jgi:predicted Fe-Mo cluster-binding NifX family protein
MKISFPTNDRKTIAERTGRCKEFAIYEIIDGQLINIDYRENTHQHHEHGEEHAHQKAEGEHAHQEIIKLLSDVDLSITLRIGKFLKKDLDENKMNYQITKNIEIEDALNEYLNSF